MNYSASITSEMFPSSFVDESLRSTSDVGHDQSKLYLSNEYALEYYINFFGNYSSTNKYYFVKQYLLDYLEDPIVVREYTKNATKHPNIKDISRTEMIMNITSNYDSHIQVNLENGLCEDFKGSYYIYSYDHIFKEIIKSISIPKITYLQIDKYAKNGMYIYYCFLKRS